MASFSRDEQPVRDQALNVRCSIEEMELLDRAAEVLEVKGRSDVVRAALDYFFANSPEGRRAVRRGRG